MAIGLGTGVESSEHVEVGTRFQLVPFPWRFGHSYYGMYLQGSYARKPEDGPY